ncbi:hypothetical protein RND81_06G203200 [Saponaria officinalis]|uniref:F-box domain-containing protein n=1 Tax=Saponaria officinalis TaxID=3572 RepID=A0AAW1KDZ5_SAPOF
MVCKNGRSKRRLMANSKLRRDRGEDRLSSLPDDIRIQILSRLPLRSAIVTECLSSRWRGLWTHITSINIEKGTSKFSHEFFNALKEIRSRIVSPCVHRFSFELIDGVQDAFGQPFLYSWVQQICDQNVRELKLTWLYYQGDFDRRQFPCFIFRTQSLVSIELGSASNWVLLDDCEPINLPNLKNLSIKICPSICDWLEKQIKLCPSLEQLSLICCRRLSINCTFTKNFKVVINSPKIGYLAIRAPKTWTFCFAEKPLVLREAKIDFFGTAGTLVISDELNKVKSKFYEDISNVRLLGLYIDSVDDVSTVFHNTTRLTFDMNLSHSISIVLSLLELFPNLDVLTLKFNHIGDDIDLRGLPKLKKVRNIRRALKRIEIESLPPYKYECLGSPFLDLIEYFLSNAIDLEHFKVNIGVSRLWENVIMENVIMQHNESVELQLCKLLYQCPTISKRCEVEFVGRCFTMSRKAGPKVKTVDGKVVSFNCSTWQSLLEDDILSQRIFVESVGSCWRSLRILLSQIASHAALVADTYSASADDNATVAYFLDDQEIVFDPSWKTYPLVLFLSSMLPAQSLSLNPFSL